jgi:hypothetical protein
MRRSSVENSPNSQPSALDDLQALDIRELKRFGFLATSSKATVSWKYNGEPNGQTTIEYIDGALQIRHRHQTCDSRPTTARQCVAIDYTNQPLGGTRPWFVCPDCGRRCAKLYFDYRFKCRTCTGLMYYCQRVDERHRLLARMIGIGEQLDGLALAGAFIPKRPKGMHQSRYRALVMRHDELEGKLVEAEGRRFGAG